MKVILASLLLVGCCHAVKLRSASPKAEICRASCAPHCPQSSRHGKACIPPAASPFPYKKNTTWRAELGERILAAATPIVTEDQCGGFTEFGDSTWCNVAMADKKKRVGLSFGIEQRDLWSEKMSNMFALPTKLYDCYQSDKDSKVLAGKVPNGIGKGKCKGNGQHCYETHYQAFHTCLGSKKEKQGGRQFDSIEDQLAGQGDLSVHLKMDVEGSEWAVLHRLLSEDKELAKIRTLDMEVHFGMQPHDEPLFKGMTEQQILTMEAEVMEKLGHGTHFEVTGSSLEVYREGWHPEQNCPTNQCDEPCVHLANAFPLPQFAISFVNKRLLS